MSDHSSDFGVSSSDAERIMCDLQVLMQKYGEEGVDLRAATAVVGAFSLLGARTQCPACALRMSNLCNEIVKLVEQHKGKVLN